jgi:hypothetical protein
VITTQDKAMGGNRPEDATWRSWSDLNFGWLTLGLIAGPLVPFALLAWPALLIGWLFAVTACAIGITLAAWSLLTGFTYIFLVSRLRGGIGRRESVLLGMGSASSVSIAAYAAAWLFGSNGEPLSVADTEPSPSLFLTTAIVFLPLGAIAGWIFWRIGVKPETASTARVTNVFD